MYSNPYHSIGFRKCPINLMYTSTTISQFKSIPLINTADIHAVYTDYIKSNTGRKEYMDKQFFFLIYLFRLEQCTTLPNAFELFYLSTYLQG